MLEDTEEDGTMGPEDKEGRKTAPNGQERPLGDIDLDELLPLRSRDDEEPDDLYDGEW
jgi:hypothetical protein